MQSRQAAFIRASGAAAAATIIAVTIARQVGRSQTLTWDTAVLEAIHRVTTPGLLVAAQLFTDLGPPWGITAVIAVAAAVLWLKHYRRTSAIFTGGAIVTALLNSGLKEVYERTRPDLWPRPPVSGDSFPSGHAMESAMVYGAISILLARTYPHYRWPIRAAGVALVLCIAASRAVLGVHWPTDLVAGIALGSLMLIVTIATIDRFAERDRAS